MLRVLIASALVSLAVMGPALPCAGATFTVNSAGESHDPVPGDGICGDPSLPDSLRCTLRAAVEESNALSGSDTILFAQNLSTIYLTLGSLIVSDNRTTIKGRGFETVIDGLMNPFFSSSIIVKSDSNVIRGVTVQRARCHGIVVTGSHNCIGDSSGADTTAFISNGIDRTSSAALYFTGQGSTWNQVMACRFGFNARGDLAANQNGIIIDSLASHNTVGGASVVTRNYVCGCQGYGVIIAHGAAQNQIRSCYIGPNPSGSTGFPNIAGGVLVATGAHNNRLGGSALEDFNLISLNTGPGVTVIGAASDSNTIAGNWIGLDLTGEVPIGNGSGIVISDGASSNIIGGFTGADRNIVTGNVGDGVRIVGAGTYGTILLGNLIGTDTTSFIDLGNGSTLGNGVFIGEGAGRTIIGGTQDGAANVISGNPQAGVCLAATSQNVIIGNFIGTSIFSQSSVPNGTGILVNKGSTDNVIGGSSPGEGNTISGNRADFFPNGAGVSILDAGTSYNKVIGNMIGTDMAGSRSLRNGSCGVIIGSGAQHNQIGGANPGERNIISGNGFGSIAISLGRGVHIFGTGTSFNQVAGNYIGVSANGVDSILNLGNGVGIYDGAQHNMIGGPTPAEGNLISRNCLHGIFQSGSGTAYNSFLNDMIFNNDSLGIVNRVSVGVLPPPPQLTLATTSHVDGMTAPPLGRVQVYLAAPDPSGSGEGRRIVGDGYADSAGIFSIAVSGLSPTDFVTAVATDTNGSSSEFAVNLLVDAPTSTDEHPEELPAKFALDQNFPNPFNPTTTIRYSVARAGRVRLTIFNIRGERVVTLADQAVTLGSHSLLWNGENSNGRSVASGVYLYRLEAGGLVASRKMLLLK